MASKKESITQQQVLFLLACPEWSQRKITNVFAISPRTVSGIVHGTYVAKQRGRKKKFTEEHKLYIAECVYLCPRDSSAKIIQRFEQKFPGLRISSQTVRNIIKEYGYKCPRYPIG